MHKLKLGGEKLMPKKKNQNNDSVAKNAKEELKWETARELGLDDDLQAGGDELSVREAGKIGGNMVKKLVAKGEEALVEENEEE
jgi:hypothetical protein